MKMMYGGKPVKSMKAHVFDVNSNDATMIASDLQAGKTAYSKGKKVTGTGKSFEFANYGNIFTNVATIIPSMINIVEIASLNYPVQLSIELTTMKNLDFSVSQSIGNIIIDGTTYPVTVSVIDNKIKLSCDKTIKLQIFYGRDNYV